MNPDNFVERKLAEARKLDDPGRIRHIARQLERLSAWEAAREVERLADEAEKRLGEVNA